MKGCADEEAEGWPAERLVLLVAAVLLADSAREQLGVMAAERRRGAPLRACAMSEVEREEAEAVLVKRPWLGNLDMIAARRKRQIGCCSIAEALQPGRPRSRS